MRVSIMGLKTLVYLSLLHVTALRAKSELQKQGRREGKERKLNHYGRGGLQSEALGVLALSRIISIINSLSFQEFVSIFTFGFSLREKESMYAFTVSSPFNVCHLSACEENQWSWISLCWQMDSGKQKLYTPQKTPKPLKAKSQVKLKLSHP